MLSIDQLVRMFAKNASNALPGVEQLRAGTEQLALAHQPPEPFTREDTTLGGVKGAWLTTDDSLGDRAILYVHGGGFVAGSIDSHLPISVALANLLHARVFAVDYRLSPEAMFPVPVEDCAAAFDAISTDPSIKQFAVVGDSAGAALALSMLLADGGSRTRAVDAVVAICPWVDLTCSSDSFKTNAAADPLVRRDLLQQMASHYAGTIDLDNPAVSPMHGNFDGFPPMLIQVGTREVLLGDATELDRLVNNAGVNCDLRIWPEMVHVWHAFRSWLPDSNLALREIADYLAGIWQSSSRSTKNEF